MEQEGKGSQAVAAAIGRVREEMERIGCWSDTPLEPEQYDFRAPFGGDTMSFLSWIQFVLIPTVERLVASDGPFPSTSQVGGQAIREFDGWEEGTELTSLLIDFDRVVEHLAA